MLTKIEKIAIVAGCVFRMFINAVGDYCEEKAAENEAARDFDRFRKSGIIFELKDEI
jgi:hypothetical protein